MKLIIYKLTFTETPLYFIEFQLSETDVFRITRSKGGKLQFFTEDEIKQYVDHFGDLVKMQGCEILFRLGDDYYSEE